MEYEELTKLGRELEAQMSDPEVTFSDYAHLHLQYDILVELKNRIDKAREDDIIALAAQDGCI